jgi:hypothetical protein
MKYYDVAGYAYVEKIRCAQCANAHFGKDVEDEDAEQLDEQRNPVFPIFFGNKDWKMGGLACDDCYKFLRYASDAGNG